MSTHILYLFVNDHSSDRIEHEYVGSRVNL